MELPEDLQGKHLTRRQLMERLGMVGAGAFVSQSALSWIGGPGWASVIEAAAKTKPAGSDLEAVEHIVFLMLENRSYDHYFGAYPRGRGFDDHPKHALGPFAQNYPGGSKLVPKHKLLPFHLTGHHGLESTDDLTHDWGPMHECWNHGKMDSWVKVHTSAQQEGPKGALTMGYYKRNELPFHWALADHFTLGDAYHCSILGPTHPNRLMATSGTIDPSGKHGGPVVATNGGSDTLWNCTWTTMQELLEDKGVSWKVYTPSNVGVSGKFASLSNYLTWDPTFYDPTVTTNIELTDNVLPYFTSFRKPGTPLFEKAFKQTFPNDFAADVKSGKFPSVSWIIPPLGFDEHPSASPTNGQWFVSMVLRELTSNPKVWSKTALFIMYDENDGWFDHVAPPTAPKGTAGEYLTTSTFPPGETHPDTLGFSGPLGLGVRVPLLVVSPFSRGGHIASEVFDHTSQLKLIAKRFGVEVPNVSAWRRKTVGDLTSTLFTSKKDASVPKLPKTSIVFAPSGPASFNSQWTETGGFGPSVPTKQRMPNQRGGSDPASKYFKLHKNEEEIADEARTPIDVSGPPNETVKSAANRLLAGQKS
ncbi:MAG TPA: alkaline phosphatase family protein [Solirubrobacteraceae bacterium]|jgi:phospholipase C